LWGTTPWMGGGGSSTTTVWWMSTSLTNPLILAAIALGAFLCFILIWLLLCLCCCPNCCGASCCGGGGRGGCCYMGDIGGGCCMGDCGGSCCGPPARPVTIIKRRRHRVAPPQCIPVPPPIVEHRGHVISAGMAPEPPCQPCRPAIMPPRPIEPACPMPSRPMLTISPMPDAHPNMISSRGCGEVCGGGWRGDRATVINIGGGGDEGTYGGRRSNRDDDEGCGCHNNRGYGGDSTSMYGNQNHPYNHNFRL